MLISQIIQFKFIVTYSQHGLKGQRVLMLDRLINLVYHQIRLLMLHLEKGILQFLSLQNLIATDKNHFNDA